MSTDTAVDQTPGYRVLRQGGESEAVVIIDDFFSDPELLVRDAAAQPFRTDGPYYPGIRADAPGDYLAERDDLLAEILTTVFGYSGGAEMAGCSYSLVTTPPAALQPIQRLPHFDSLEEKRVALLHYLCQPDRGGTAFYRHRKTGFETVTADRFEHYRDTLQAEARIHGLPPAQYFSGETEQFEQIGVHQARFNRAILYRGVTLHSGHIPADFGFASDVHAGRLTVNTFLIPRQT